MNDDLYYRKLESTSSTDLVDMLREKDRLIIKLEKTCDEIQELLNKQTEVTYEVVEENKELVKSKEIIKNFLAFANDVEYDLEHTSLWNELCEQAEQFLRDIDIDNAIRQVNKELNFDRIADEMAQDLKELN